MATLFRRLRSPRRLAPFAILAGLLFTPSHEATGQTTVVGRRPSIPYRVWYGVGSNATDAHSIQIRPNMTISTGGRADSRLLDSYDVCDLGWIYGTQITWNGGAAYYEDHVGVSRRTVAANSTYNYNFVRPGVGMDEWQSAHYPDVWQWIPQGLRDGRMANREVFVGVWVANTVREELYQMGRDGTVDLFMVQGYTHSVQQGLGLYWSDAIARVENFAQRGLLPKTIFTFGHITDLPNWKGGTLWTEASLRQKMEDLKRRYPTMRGVAFFPGGVGDPVAYENLVRLADRLSKEYWPDNWVPDGVYSLTPQHATKTRLDADNAGTSNGTRVSIWQAKYPNSSTHQQWRFTSLGSGVFRIQPSYSSAVSLDVQGAGSANGTKVQLYQNNNTNAQKWRLTQVPGGFKLSPLCAPNSYLHLPSASNNTQAQIMTNLNNDSQVFALAPEFCPLDPVPPYYPAENAQLQYAYVESNHPGSIGGFVNPSARGKITWTNVDGGSGGSKAVTFRYALDTSPRTIDLIVNGNRQTITFQPTGGWGTWENASAVRTLQPGTTNTIVLEATGSDGPNVDKMTIFPTP